MDIKLELKGTYMTMNLKSKGVALMLLSALSTCVGQLFWKLAASRGAVCLLIGFALYGCGALLMIFALRFGELSALHPLLGAGYVLSILLGAVFLNEAVSPLKILGIAIIICGLVLISKSEGKL